MLLVKAVIRDIGSTFTQFESKRVSALPPEAAVELVLVKWSASDPQQPFVHWRLDHLQLKYISELTGLSRSAELPDR